MANGQNVTAKMQQPKTSIHKAWKIVGVTVVVIVGTILSGWGILEYQYQQRLAPLSREVNNISLVVTHTRGVEYSSHINCPHWLDTTGAADIICPEVDHAWFVPIDQNKEDIFMGHILQSEGYGSVAYWQEAVTGERHASGSKGNVLINLGITGLSGSQAPYPAADGKEWRIVAVNIYYAPTISR